MRRFLFIFNILAPLGFAEPTCLELIEPHWEESYPRLIDGDNSFALGSRRVIFSGAGTPKAPALAMLTAIGSPRDAVNLYAHIYDRMLIARWKARGEPLPYSEPPPAQLIGHSGHVQGQLHYWIDQWQVSG